MVKIMRLFLLTILLCCNALAENVVIDDYKMRQNMNKGIDSLKKNNEIVDINTLYKQLERKSCEVKLAPLASSPLTTKQIFAKYKNSVLMVGRAYKCNRCPDWHTSIASGFIISEDGVAVTNYHVMQKSRGDAMAVMTLDQKAYAIKEVIAADKEADIAIIRIGGKGFTPIPVSGDNGPGTKLTAITHPNGRYFTVTEGIVSRHYMQRKGKRNVQWMAITADYAKGSSGGPIFNEKGEIAGMVSSTYSIYYNKENGIDKNLQMVIKNCVPSQSILKLIKKKK